jgi:hypothetical protein
MDPGTDMTYDGPMPGAGGFANYQVALNTAYDNATTAVSNQRSQWEKNSGANYGADGSVTFNANAGNDLNTSWGQMMTGDAQNANQYDAAASQQGFHGGLANQLGEQNAKQYSANAANWATQFGQQGNAFAQADVNNLSSRNNQAMQGLVSDVTAAIANHTYNSADYTGLPVDGFTGSPDDLKAILDQIPGAAPTVSTAPPPGTDTTGTSTGGGGMHGGVDLSQHPHYAAAVRAGYGKSYAKWVAAGRPPK